MFKTTKQRDKDIVKKMRFIDIRWVPDESRRSMRGSIEFYIDFKPGNIGKEKKNYLVYIFLRNLILETWFSKNHWVSEGQLNEISN